MITYFNQIRATRDSKPLDNGDWTDACAGHKTYEQALCCSLAHEDMLKGKEISAELAPMTTQAGLAVHGAIYDALNIKLEMRIVKRTTTDEVLDA